MNRKKLFLPALLLVVAAASFAFGDAFQSSYRALRGTIPAVVHNGISVAQSTTWTTALNPLPTYGNPSVTVQAKFSTQAATCVAQLGAYFKNDDGTYSFLGVVSAQTITAAATAAGADGSLYVATTLPTWDTRGVAYYDLRLTTISAGTVTTRIWGYGAASGQ